jgi:DNA-binding phage protein
MNADTLITTPWDTAEFLQTPADMAAYLEAIMELIDDMELLKLVQERLHEESVEVDLEELSGRGRNEIYEVALARLRGRAP